MRYAVALSLICASAGWNARADDMPSPLHEGAYVSLSATAVLPQDTQRLDDGYGGTVALGLRKDFYAVEIAPSYVGLDKATASGVSVNGLLFPLRALPNGYATVGLGTVQYTDFASSTGPLDFNTTHVDGGLGYLWPLTSGRYEFGLRAEAQYRVGRRERDFNHLDQDFDAPTSFKQWVLNIGMQLPTRKLPPVLEAPEPPVQVVPVCSDGKDNDQDGLPDHPADAGCASADDDDETDLCKTAAPGERVSLQGCGTGEVIVLQGVNFEFDSPRLTAGGMTVLDGVAGELTAYPEIKIEIGGHTDARGSDGYNQSLSEARAASVVEYLESKAVAANRMRSRGYGESQPVAENETDEGRERNRRVELKVVGN